MYNVSRQKHNAKVKSMPDNINVDPRKDQNDISIQLSQNNLNNNLNLSTEANFKDLLDNEFNKEQIDNESDKFNLKRSSLQNQNNMAERELSKINDVEIDYKNDFRNSRNTFSKQMNYETINSRLNPGSASN